MEMHLFMQVLRFDFADPDKSLVLKHEHDPTVTAVTEL